MNVRRAIPLCLSVLVVSAGAAFAADIDPCRQKPSTQADSPQVRHDRRVATDLIDQGTETAMRLTRLPSGALQVDIDGGNLEVRKTLHANGDFDLALKADDDQFAVVRRGEQVRVSRRNRTVDIGIDALGDADLDRLQQVLAGSSAVRRFRAMKSMLTPATRCTGLGAAVDIIDLLIGVLKGEPPAPMPAATAPMLSAVSAVEEGDGTDTTSCYLIFAAEVMAAWKDYEDCIYSFAWYNPLREVCAFVWVIRVESAWFRLIGCSAIPWKVQACEVGCEDIPR